MTDSAFQAANMIQQLAPNFTPKLAMVLGSGLGALADLLDDPITIVYDQLPGFPPCTVSGHGGKLFLGYLEGVPVAFLQGRAHFYEGVSHEVAQTYVRAMKLIGCESFISTNAAGSMRESVRPGELVLITDHINFQFKNILHGHNDDRFGPRFIGMEDAYNLELRNQLSAAAKKLNITLHEGVYFAVLGPSFETPAEIRAFKLLGGDVVGMSTLNEVIVAHHCKMRVAVVSVMTNMAAGMSDEALSHDLTLSGAASATDKLQRLMVEFIRSER